MNLEVPARLRTDKQLLISTSILRDNRVAGRIDHANDRVEISARGFNLDEVGVRRGKRDSKRNTRGAVRRIDRAGVLVDRRLIKWRISRVKRIVPLNFGL